VAVELEVLGSHGPRGLAALQLGDSLPVLHVLLVDLLELGLVFQDLILVAGDEGALLVGEGFDVQELGDDVHFVLDELLAHADFGFVLVDPLVLGAEIVAPSFEVFPQVVGGGLLRPSLVLALEQRERDLGQQGEEGLSDGHDDEKMDCER
jgi:hypothetical protein